MKKLFSELAQTYKKQGCLGKTVLIIVFLTVASIFFSLGITFLPIIIGFFIIRFIAQKVPFENKTTKYAVLITFALFSLFANGIWATILGEPEAKTNSQEEETQITNQQQPSPEQNENTSEEQELTDNTEDEEVLETEENTETPKEEPIPEKIEEEPTPETPNYEYYDVVKVVDGDTIKINYNGTTESIRFIGIDTPETVDPNQPVQCFGVEASNKAKQLMQNKKVRLEFDSTQGERDKYNRLLAYVFLEDGTHVNYKMIREGFAFEYTYNLPYQHMDSFKEAQRLAREEEQGLWSSSTCNGVASSVVTPEPEPTPTPTPEPTPTPNSPYTCDCNKSCPAMSSCEEAYFQLNTCGCTARDRDKDGIPCEDICL